MTEQSTILGLFHDRVRETPDTAALLERHGDRWFPFTWKEWRDRSRALASALLEDGVAPGEHVGIFSYTRRQWVESDIAILMCGAQTTTLYQSLHKETVDYVVNDSQTGVMIVEGPVQLRQIFGEDKKGGVPSCIRRIVYILEEQAPAPRPGQDEPEPFRVEQVVPESHMQLLIPYEEYLEHGKELLARRGEELDGRIAAVTPDTLAKVVYTSGTTGTPKGAMLTHGNLTSVVATIDVDLGIERDDLCLLFLPLAHVYAQLTYHAQLKCGFRMGFARSMLTAVDDAESLKPNFFTTVPRLFEKIHAGALHQVEQAGGLKKKIFDWATEVGYEVSRTRQAGEEVKGALSVKAALADKFVFSKLKKRLGGNIKFMVSGGAPLPRPLIEFFDAAGLVIVEGYGMTENASLSNYNRPGAIKFGTVGQALASAQVAIADDGEILVKGPNVMKGYQNQPEETRETIDEAGWLHTGDIGVIDQDGFLTITDRKKDLIVTSGGKNIPPAPIEAKLMQIRFVSQAVVFGDARKFLVALVTLDMEYAEAWARDNGVTAGPDEIHSDPRIVSAVEAEIARVNRGLESYETVKKIKILPTEFSMDKGEVTPSLKLRRRVIAKNYQQIIDSLYPPESGRC